MNPRATTLTPFGLKAREYRIAFGKSIGDQAEAFSVSPSDVSSIETGQTIPDADYIERFCTWLGLGKLDESILGKLASYTGDNTVRFKLPREHRDTRRLFRKINRLTPAQIRNLSSGDERSEKCRDR